MRVSDFNRFILPEVIGCPEPTLEQAIVMATHEFCSETGAWDEVQDPQSLEAGNPDYDIDPPVGASLVRVRDVWIDGRPLTAAPYEAMANLSISMCSPINFNASISRSQIRLFPTPSQSGGQLVVRAVYAPKLTATSLPDFLLEDNADTIASGAKSRLMLMPNVQWSNPQLAGYYKEQFKAGILSSRIESLHDRVEGSIRVKPRKFI